VRQLHLFALRLRLQTPVTSRPPTHSSLGAGWPVKLGHWVGSDRANHYRAL